MKDFFSVCSFLFSNSVRIATVSDSKMIQIIVFKLKTNFLKL